MSLHNTAPRERKIYLNYFKYFFFPEYDQRGVRVIYNKCNGNCTNTRVHFIASHINGKLVKWYNLTGKFCTKRDFI